MHIHVLLGAVLTGWLLFGLFSGLSPAQGQTHITPDGTLGTTVTQDGTVYHIRAGVIRGANQFHSFDDFRVGTGDTARFDGPSGIEHIFSRVTGGVLSDIDGMLSTAIDGANLFLLNPSGVVFGPNAALNVTGSFHVSTADELRFVDHSIFTVDLLGDSRLTMAAPAAFSFLRENPGGIAIQGSHLKVGPGETLSLIGGNLDIVGGEIRAESGRVNLVSVAFSGEVPLQTVGQGVDLSMETFPRLGDVTMTDGAEVHVGGNTGGTVVIRSGQLEIDESVIEAMTDGDQGGDAMGIDIDVMETVTLRNEAMITSESRGAGDGGAVEVSATNITLRDRARIHSLAESFGQGGNVTVRASNTLILENSSSISASSIAFGFDEAGAGGAVEVSATHIQISNGSEMITFVDSLGDGGALKVSASDTLILDSSRIGSATSGLGGLGGAVDVSAATIRIRGQSDIIAVTGLDSSNSTFPSHGGSVTVRASNTLTLEGGARIISRSVSAGKAGTVDVHATKISLSDESDISSTSFFFGDSGRLTVSASDILTLQSGSIIATDALGEGNGEAVDIDARVIQLSGGSAIRSLTGIDMNRETRLAGDGGRMTIHALDTLILEGNSSISSRTEGIGDGGAIDVRAKLVQLRDGSDISSLTGSNIDSSTAAFGHGGNVAVRASDMLTLEGGSSISSRSTDVGDGGAIDVSAKTIRIRNDSGIRSLSGSDSISLTLSIGDAGNLTVSALDTLTLENRSNIASRSTSEGNAGNINVSAREIGLSDRSGIGSFTEPDESGLFVDSDGTGGNVRVSASDTLRLESASTISSDSSGLGNTGSVEVDATAIQIADGSRISSDTTGVGQGGRVRVTATETVTIAGAGSGLTTRATDRGDSGAITLEAQTIELSNGAEINATSKTSGNAGSITIIAAENFRSDNSSVTTDAGSSDGGDIALRVQNIVRLNNAELGASVGGSSATTGGNLRVDADFIIALDSRIVAEAQEGTGGDIQLSARQLVLFDPQTIVDASSELGIDGSVDVRAPVTDLSANPSRLPQTFIASHLPERCAQRWRSGNVSQFVHSGRDGLPMQPGQLLPGALVDFNRSRTRSTAYIRLLSMPPQVYDKARGDMSDTRARRSAIANDLVQREQMARCLGRIHRASPRRISP